MIPGSAAKVTGILVKENTKPNHASFSTKRVTHTSLCVQENKHLSVGPDIAGGGPFTYSSVEPKKRHHHQKITLLRKVHRYFLM